MICKRCGAEVDEENVFCPKCGKPTGAKKKSNVGKMIGISLPVVLIGVGIALYASGFYKNILPKSQEAIEEVRTVADITATDENEPVKEPETIEEVKEIEEIEEVEDELEQYLDSLSLEPVEMTMGESFHVELEQEIPDAVWKSSNEDVAKITDGLIKAVAPGNTKVTLSSSGKELSFDVTVNAFADMTLAVDCSAAMEMNDAVSNVRWESSEPETVSVNDGVISSLGAGAATITAYIEEVPYSFEVVATTPDITTTSVRKIIGNTEQVSILGTKGEVEWKSDNTAIATVSDTGLITAEGTGAGQSTVVHAYVDGMEFKIDVEVEPIPQLSSTYKFYGHDESSARVADVTICTNANEIVTVNPEKAANAEGFATVNSVLNVADADYSAENVFPMYRMFKRHGGKWQNGKPLDTESHADIYLVGTSQEADVLVQQLGILGTSGGYYDENWDRESSVTYEACENYGIIHIYSADMGGPYLLPNTMCLVTVSVDGYTYQFVVGGCDEYGGLFRYPNSIDQLPPKYMVEECVVNEIEKPEYANLNQSTIVSNSKTYNPGNEWVERIGTKFVESLEDQAINMAAGALLKFIFL